MLRTLVLAVALASASTASAAEWEFFADCGTSGQRRIYQYDSSSLRSDGRHVLVQVRGDYSQHTSTRARESRLLWSINCSNRTYLERTRTDLDSAGRVVGTYRAPTGVMQIIPGSVTDKLFNRVCA